MLGNKQQATCSSRRHAGQLSTGPHTLRIGVGLRLIEPPRAAYPCSDKQSSIHTHHRHPSPLPPLCRDGYTNVLGVCWKNCPSGEAWLGLQPWHLTGWRPAHRREGINSLVNQHTILPLPAHL